MKSPFNRMSYRGKIVLVPGVGNDRPVIGDTQITVLEVLDDLAAGKSYDEVLADFPQLTKEDILNCFAYITDEGRELTRVQPAAAQANLVV